MISLGFIVICFYVMLFGFACSNSRSVYRSIEWVEEQKRLEWARHQAYLDGIARAAAMESQKRQEEEARLVAVKHGHDFSTDNRVCSHCGMSELDYHMSGPIPRPKCGE